MRLDDVPDEHVLGVPDSVKVVGHQVDPVRIGKQAEEVEVLEVPVRRRCCECKAEGVPGCRELGEGGDNEKGAT